MSTPEQDRLAEIKQRADGPIPTGLVQYADWIADCRSDRTWLLQVVEQLRTAEAGFAQRLNDVRDEFQKQLQVVEGRTQQLRASHSRLLVNLQSLLQEVADPGTEALGAVWEAQQLVTGQRTENGGA